MRWRPSIADASAAVFVLVVLLLPPRSMDVRAAYVAAKPSQLRRIAEYQGELAERPGDGAVAEKLADVLIDLGQTDWAVRVAGAAAAHAEPATAWKALLAASWAHAARLEIRDADRFAHRAVAACDRPGAVCSAPDRVRLSMYETELDRGLSSGIDPRLEPSKFREAIERVFPTATFRTGARRAGQ